MQRVYKAGSYGHGSRGGTGLGATHILIMLLFRKVLEGAFQKFVVALLSTLFELLTEGSGMMALASLREVP